MKINKKLIQCISFTLLAASISAFNWPQQEIGYKSISSYFGQKRGIEMSRSMVFADPSEIGAIDEGEILIIMSEILDQSDFFPSTLGTSVIISHEDDLISVYGNLDTDTITNTIRKNDYISQGELIGTTGNSGWQEDRSNLEFQILDLKNKAAINPKLLMPRTENELNLSLSNIALVNKTGDIFYLDLHNTLNAGIYKVYQKRNKAASPYKTTITINGVTVDQITFDKINEENGKLYVNGKKKYINSDVFLNNELSLLGEVTLSPGRSTLGLSSEDFIGDKTKMNFNLTIFN